MTNKFSPPEALFVDDYRQLVRNLMASKPLDEAMSLSVGGSFDAIGEIEKSLLLQLGLQHNHTVLDVGCGSGRLASALRGVISEEGAYYGSDVVSELLQYAAREAPPNWHFALVNRCHIPFQDVKADFVTFFSVFTHLFQEEIYYYLQEAKRVLKPGGKVVFSFLEFECAAQWPTFEGALNFVRHGKRTPHLNIFLARSMIEVWANRLGYRIEAFHGCQEPFIQLTAPVEFDNGGVVSGMAALGQSVAVLSLAS
ncbi:MAG: class I SAM-dependent methyltransferase [Zoogloea sp.]|nr:class I SAM-dependent methyltransferase [Zoogloea sp.]